MKRRYFSKLEREKICEIFKNGVIIRKIAEIFKCSGTPIRKVLMEILGLEKYAEIAKLHSKENRQKTVRKMQNHPNTIAVRLENGRRMGANQFEERNPNWKGGISKLEFEKSHGIPLEEWKVLAQEIRKRDKFICQYCGEYPSTTVHHIIPRFIEFNNHPDNLIVLCQKCHPKVESLTNKYLKENRDPIEIFYEKWNQT